MPELTTQYKASTVKYMQYWLHDFLMSEPAVPDSDNRRNCSYALAMFQFMLDTHSEWFEQDQANRTAEYGYSFLLFYQALAVRSRGELRNNYKIVSKFHYFFHLQEYIETTLRNPRLVVSKNIHPCVSKLTVLSGGGVLVGTKLMPKGMICLLTKAPHNSRYEHCYPDESLMGQLAKIASRCHASTLEKTCLHRYRVLLDLFLVSGLHEERPD